MVGRARGFYHAVSLWVRVRGSWRRATRRLKPRRRARSSARVPDRVWRLDKEPSPTSPTADFEFGNRRGLAASLERRTNKIAEENRRQSQPLVLLAACVYGVARFFRSCYALERCCVHDGPLCASPCSFFFVFLVQVVAVMVVFRCSELVPVLTCSTLRWLVRCRSWLVFASVFVHNFC